MDLEFLKKVTINNGINYVSGRSYSVLGAVYKALGAPWPGCSKEEFIVMRVKYRKLIYFISSIEAKQLCDNMKVRITPKEAKKRMLEVVSKYFPQVGTKVK